MFNWFQTSGITPVVDMNVNLISGAVPITCQNLVSFPRLCDGEDTKQTDPGFLWVPSRIFLDL